MSTPLRDYYIVILLTVLGIVTHAIPHEMGISTVGAISMFAAACLPRRLLLIPVLLTILVVDLLQGGYGMLALGIVYLAHLSAAFVLSPCLNKVTGWSFASAALLNALVFYLVSNLVPMVLAYYPATVSGWINCYANGVPFLLKGVLANLGFGGVGFATIYVIGQVRAHRVITTQRH